MKQPTITLSHITSGFIISHLLLALMGTLGRLIHVSFDIIKILLVFASLLLILKYILSTFQSGIKVFIWQVNANKVLPVLLLLLVAIVASFIVIQRVLSDDDLSYLAYITNWQNSTHLDFQDVIFGESELVMPRFWLMSAPFAQALLADISQIPGVLLLSGYYEPFLVVIAVLCWYNLARSLGISSQAASASSILQLVFLLFLSEYLHPGAPFFRQLSADKATAAFIIAPVFFQSLIRLLDRSTTNNFIMLFMAGFSLTLMHPIILAYSAFIGGVIILFNRKNINWANKLITLLILFAILLPQIILRFINIPSHTENPYTTQDVFSQPGIENMIERWGDTQFYGFNPDILVMNIPYGEKIPIQQSLMTRAWLIFPLLSTIFALKQNAKNHSAQFLLASFLLGLLAWIPFTGWIIGYFLSAYMLERAIWLFPFGLSVVYTFSFLRDFLKKKHPKLLSNWKLFMSPNRLLVAVTVISIGLFSLYLHENDLPDFEKFLDKSQRYRDLSIAGKELDHRISDRAYVIGSPNLNGLIPGLSWKSDLITFRISDPSNMFYFTSEEREERIADTGILFSKTTSAEDKLSLFEKYHIQFLFLQRADILFFKNLIETYPEKIKATEIGGVIIVEIHH